MDQLAERDERITEGYRAGQTLKALGRGHGLTSERIRQILDIKGEPMRNPGRRPGPRQRKPMPKSVQERFFSRITFKTEDGRVHWIWSRSDPVTGYGTFRLDGVIHYAHRAAFYLIKGRWPVRLRSLCNYRACVNPDCWEEQTGADSSQ